MASIAGVVAYPIELIRPPTLLLNGGSPTTTDPMVTLSIFAPDRLEGTKDIVSMRIFGASIDVVADPSYGISIDTTSMIPFKREVQVPLTVTPGVKEIDVWVYSLAGSSASSAVTITYSVNTAAPIVTMLKPPRPIDGRLSSLFLNQVEFDYRIDQACNQIDLALVNTLDTTHANATVFRSIPGSYAAGKLFTSVGAVPTMSIATVTELTAAGAVSGRPLMVKVFAKRTSDGVWSL